MLATEVIFDPEITGAVPIKVTFTELAGDVPSLMILKFLVERKRQSRAVILHAFDEPLAAYISEPAVEGVLESKIQESSWRLIILLDEIGDGLTSLTNRAAIAAPLNVPADELFDLKIQRENLAVPAVMQNPPP